MIIGNIDSIPAINDTLVGIQRTQKKCQQLTDSFQSTMMKQLALLQTWYNSSLSILQQATLYKEVLN